MRNDDDYTPTTEEVRSEYQAGVTNCGCCLDEHPEDAADFDRWLHAERARVWDEAVQVFVAWATDNACAEAERRYPGWVNGTVPFPDGLEESRELAREYFIEGAEWAAGRAEPTTATTEDDQ